MKELKIDAELYKEWLELDATKAFRSKLSELENERLKSIVVSSNKEEACGIVKGITLVISLLWSAKEDGL